MAVHPAWLRWRRSHATAGARRSSRTLPDLQPSFDRFTAGLKAEAERG